jgi:hypothetical protein
MEAQKDTEIKLCKTVAVLAGGYKMWEMRENKKTVLRLLK